MQAAHHHGAGACDADGGRLGGGELQGDVGRHVDRVGIKAGGVERRHIKAARCESCAAREAECAGVSEAGAGTAGNTAAAEIDGEAGGGDAVEIGGGGEVQIGDHHRTGAGDGLTGGLGGGEPQGGAGCHRKLRRAAIAVLEHQVDRRGSNLGEIEGAAVEHKGGGVAGYGIELHGATAADRVHQQATDLGGVGFEGGACSEADRLEAREGGGGSDI